MIERISSENISAAEALAMEMRPKYELMSYAHGVILAVGYINIIVTTAKLKVAFFEPDEISIADGKFQKPPRFEDVPYIRFRKQLSMRPHNFRANQQAYEIASAKEHTVFVVNSEKIAEFLEAFSPNRMRDFS